MVALAFALSGGLITQSALAATAPPPESATSCGGGLHRAKPTPDDPYLISYQFNCNWGISSYTLIVLRKPNDDSTIDDFSSSVTVVDWFGNPVSTQSFDCFGAIPGDGINCNAPTAGGYMSAPNSAEGTFDLTEPYCANIPKGSPPGTKPDPAAVVQLVVTDTTGAEDGPFRLRLGGKCPALHGKPRSSSKSNSKSKSGSSKSTGKGADS